MKTAHTLMILCASALLAAGPPAHAQDGSHTVNLLAAREQLIATFDAMPAARLEAYFLRCSKEASLTLLPLEDAVACAVAWDTLLRREFRGDVEALLGWWRERRDD